MKSLLEKERKVRKLISDNSKSFYISVFLSSLGLVFIGLIALVPPFFMRKVIDDYIPQKDYTMLFSSIAIFTIIPLITSAARTYYQYKLAIICRDTATEYSILGIKNILYQPLSFFSDNQSSELASFSTNDSNSYLLFWMRDIPVMISEFITGTAVLIIMFYLDIRLTLIVLFYIPCAIFPPALIAKKIQKEIQAVIKNNAKFSQLVNDSFKGIKTVKSMLLELNRIDLIKDTNKNILKIWGRVAALDNLTGQLVHNTFDTFFNGAAFSIGGILVMEGYISLGALIAFIGYLPRYMNSVKQLSSTNYNFKKTLAKHEKFFSYVLMDSYSNEYEKGDDFIFNNSIKFDKLSFKYNSDYTLKDVCFQVNRAEWIGIIGESGIGKTTIFNLLLRFYNPEKGKILIDDKDISLLSLKQIRKNITFIEQSPFFFPGTIRENLVYAKKDASSGELNEALNFANLKSFVNKLPENIDTQIGENGFQLSAGERQRLAIARGILKGGRVFLFDEITSNIDQKSQSIIKNNIKKFYQNNQVTIISISHQLEFLSETDHVFYIDRKKHINKLKYKDLDKNYSFLFDNVDKAK